jgi:hypothetical protein
MPPSAIANDAEYNDEQREVLTAVETYKQQHHVRFITATDLLNVLKALGYRRVQTS